MVYRIITRDPRISSGECFLSIDISSYNNAKKICDAILKRNQIDNYEIYIIENTIQNKTVSFPGKGGAYISAALADIFLEQYLIVTKENLKQANLATLVSENDATFFKRKEIEKQTIVVEKNQKSLIPFLGLSKK